MKACFGEEVEELFDDAGFQEEPRRLDEISAAETEMFDRIWYHRSLQHDYGLEDEAMRTNLRSIDASPVLGGSGWSLRTPSRDSWDRTQISNWAC